jgi:tRNA (guanine26-N2/guanine27-N2)-dimethyltransferase
MAAVAADWGWQDCERLLATMLEEAGMPPYYYPLAEIGRRGRMDIPPRDRLIQAICDRTDGAIWASGPSYRASRTHLAAQALKTDAPLSVCLEIARKLNALSRP